MKLLIIILSLTFINKGCSSKIDQDKLILEYIASSRGLYKNIILNQKTVSIVNKRDAKPKIKECNDQDWDNILNVLKQVDVENISNLKPPSKAFQYDGAAIARLKIVYNNNTYETPSFDHGNPPEDIKRLVNEILSISENVE